MSVPLPSHTLEIFFTFQEGIMFLCLGPTSGQALCAGRVVTCVLGSGENLVLGLRGRKVSAIARRKGVLSAQKREERSPGRAPPPLHADVRRFATRCSPLGSGPTLLRMSLGHLYLDVLRLDLHHVPVLPGGSSSTEPLQPEISESFSTHPASPPRLISQLRGFNL